MKDVDRQVIADLYLSRSGIQFLTELVEKFGSRFGGSEEERRAAEFIEGAFRDAGADRTYREKFTCQGWKRKSTTLTATAPQERKLDCIALPYCPPGEVEAPLVYLGDGHPQVYEDRQEEIEGAVVMVTTATPRFYHRTMHRGEKLGRAIEAGAIGFIWMRGEPGGLPETGSARFGRACEVPAISVSYETGHEILRMNSEAGVRVRIESSNEIYETTSYNVIGELTGSDKPEEVIVVGGHYDGHDISQAAADNGAGVAVALEAMRALVPHKDHLSRTIRFVAFAQEEMGLIGSEHHAEDSDQEKVAFMLNLDGAGRGDRSQLVLQGWPEAVRFFNRLAREIYERDMSVGDSLSLYSDMYPFARRGIPSATFSSKQPGTSAAPRGYGHTYWDSLDKVNERFLQMDASRVARIITRLAALDELPMDRKTPEQMGDIIRELGFDMVLRYEGRSIPGEKEPE